MKKRFLTILLSTAISSTLLLGCQNSKFNLRSRENKTAKEATLSSGEWEVGKDINEGRYTIFSKGDTNNLTILNPEVEDISNIYKNVYTILDEKGKEGVESITCNLKKGEVINISGKKQVQFTPAKKLKDNSKLTSGDWEVGVDIVPGKYKVKSEKESGNFIILNKDRSKAKVNEILDSNGCNGLKELECELNDGEIVELRGVHIVDFERL